MAVGFLLERFGRNADRDAVIWDGRAWSYGRLLETIEDWWRRLDAASLPAGSVVSIEADFSPNAVALLLALVERRCIVVPLTRSVEGKKPEFRDIAAVERIVSIGEGDEAAIESWPATGTPTTMQRCPVRPCSQAIDVARRKWNGVAFDAALAAYGLALAGEAAVGTVTVGLVKGESVGYSSLPYDAVITLWLKDEAAAITARWRSASGMPGP